MPPQLVHLLLADFLHFLLQLELVSFHLELEVDLANPRIQLVNLFLKASLASCRLFDLLLELNDNLLRPDDVIVDNNSLLLTLKLLAQVLNRFVLLADKVVLTFVAQLALPKSVDQGLIDVLLPVSKDYAKLTTEKHLRLGLITSFSHGAELFLQFFVVLDEAINVGSGILGRVLELSLCLIQSLVELLDLFFESVVLVQEIIQLGSLRLNFELVFAEFLLHG